MAVEHDRRGSSANPDGARRDDDTFKTAEVSHSVSLVGERLFYLDDTPLLVKTADMMCKKLGVSCSSLVHEGQSVDVIISAIRMANPTILVLDFSLAHGLKSPELVHAMIDHHPELLRDMGVVFYSSEVGDSHFEDALLEINQKLQTIGHRPAVVLAKPHIVAGLRSVFRESRHDT